MRSEKKILFEVEYESAPIRHVYVTCPECGKKFDANDIIFANSIGVAKSSSTYIRDDYDLNSYTYRCPCCDQIFQSKRGYVHAFGDDSSKVYDVEIKEVGYPECAKGALQKREVWE